MYGHTLLSIRNNVSIIDMNDELPLPWQETCVWFARMAWDRVFIISVVCVCEPIMLVCLTVCVSGCVSIGLCVSVPAILMTVFVVYVDRRPV